MKKEEETLTGEEVMVIKIMTTIHIMMEAVLQKEPHYLRTETFLIVEEQIAIQKTIPLS